MTNWKTFKITKKTIGENRVLFQLDNCVTYKDGEWRFIYCSKVSPLTEYQESDYLEIDLEATKHHKGYEVCYTFSNNEVRKVSSSAVVPSSSSNQQITSNQIQERDERMRRWVEASGGEYEVDFIARQEYRDDGRISANELKWTYRKK